VINNSIDQENILIAILVCYIGGRDSIPVRGVPYEPITLLRIYRTKIKSNSR
jgi:hypothetical protein